MASIIHRFPKCEVQYDSPTVSVMAARVTYNELEVRVAAPCQNL
jgi:hypothetical protein